MKRSLAILALGLGLVVLAPLRAELTPVADKRPDVRGPAGAYSVNVPRPASITYGDSWILIDWSSPGPGPSPAPSPAPVPTPLPVPAPTPPAPTPPIPPAPAPAPKPVATGKLFATLITDQQVTDDLAAFKGAMAFAGDQLKALDVAWHVYVVGQAELKTLNLAEHIPPAGPPIVIVQELKPGETVAPVIATVKPTTAEALLEDLAKLRGK